MRLNCGVPPRCFPRILHVVISPHPAFYTTPHHTTHVGRCAKPLAAMVSGQNVPSSKCPRFYQNVPVVSERPRFMLKTNSIGGEEEEGMPVHLTDMCLEARMDCLLRLTAFSLPGQFAPRSESSNRILANSLPGTIAISFPGPFAPWNICYVELSLPGTNVVGNLALWNFCSHIVYPTVY